MASHPRPMYMIPDSTWRSMRYIFVRMPTAAPSHTRVSTIHDARPWSATRHIGV